MWLAPPWFQPASCTGLESAPLKRSNGVMAGADNQWQWRVLSNFGPKRRVVVFALDAVTQILTLILVDGTWPPASFADVHSRLPRQDMSPSGALTARGRGHSKADLVIRMLSI